MTESEKILAIVRASRPQVAVIGVGGAGCNIVSWVKDKRGGVSGAKLIAANTDAVHLNIIKADRRVLLGEKTTRGMGAGGYADKGAKAAMESIHQIRKDVAGSNIIYVAAGLGGGTGTGASHVIASELRSTGALMIGVVTLPFAVERFRFNSAKDGLQKLKWHCDTVVVIDNNKLAKYAGNLPLKEALGVANELVGEFVKGITETITTASLINIDFADLRAIMEKRGVAAIGVGEASGERRVEKAVQDALNAQLLDIKDASKAFGVLIHVSGGEDIKLDEVTQAGEIVTRSLPTKARVVWGARVDPTLRGKVRVMVVLTGIECNFAPEKSSSIARMIRVRN
ncbi:MAG: cell division protein FtsZ [Nitrososphaerota archaeon]|nr:cell division protein FtsZ [Nitrososphaerota archaeon]MDG6921750.1 cell division protein FtsZ [Nitrososphaerota archaeon]